MPMSPPNALQLTPFSEETAAALGRIVEGLDAPGLWWLSGYAAGLATRGAALPQAAPGPRPAAVEAGQLTIVYASQTGNARRVAEQLAEDARAGGIDVRLLRADAYSSRELKTERHLVLVVSTQGEGEPSDDARELHAFVLGKRAPRLEQLQFAVLGLGDTSYPEFCAVARQLDARLAELGGQRLLELGEADLDIETVAVPWRGRAIAAAKDLLKPIATVTPLRPHGAAAPSAFSREAPFGADVLVNQRITTRGSDKDVRHIEVSLEGAGLSYQPGDALGLWPRNAEALVDAVLATTRLDGDAPVIHGGAELPLREWLSSKRELTRLARPFVAAHAERANDDALRTALSPDNATALAGWLSERQVIDLLQDAPGQWDATALVAALRPLTPRLYSIASSQKAVGNEAHLTVAHVAYARAGQPRWGVASHLLADTGEDQQLPIYIEPNERFRLPADPARDVIMIGPGTGVAPFRGFLQERTAIGASGRNWLLFGNPRFRSDFLYQLEWQRALKAGTLDRIDLAFSRDGANKVYVQHRLREQGRALFDWLEGGAHLYVCGALAMGRDVHQALLEIFTEHAGGHEAAAERLSALQSQGRYAREVY